MGGRCCNICHPSHNKETLIMAKKVISPEDIPDIEFNITWSNFAGLTHYKLEAYKSKSSRTEFSVFLDDSGHEKLIQKLLEARRQAKSKL